MKVPDDILASPSPWLAQAVAGLQIELDNQYATAVARYNGEVKDWIAENQQNRDIGHPISQFLFTKPVHYIAYAAVGDTEANRNGQVKQYAADVDPALPDAVLPPPMHIAASEPILGPGRKDSGVAPTTFSVNDLLALLQSLEARLAKLGA